MNTTAEGNASPQALTLERLHQAIGAIQEARSRRHARVQRIQDTAKKLGDIYESHGKEARQELAVALKQHKQVGWPPSFVQVAGQSSLEKPFNRLLAWLCQPHDHGLGSTFLQRLARTVDLDDMASDLADGDQPVLRFEESFTDESSKQPDVVVLTRRAALLLENKVNAGESGDQYGPYKEAFKNEAGEREKRLILCSRKTRETPPGWKPLLHAQIASILRDLSQDDELPFWGRVSAIIAASAFEDGVTPEEMVREAGKLLTQARLLPADVVKMLELSRKMNEMNIPVIELKRSDR